jgi:uncharacterized protein (TIGR02246 family)
MKPSLLLLFASFLAADIFAQTPADIESVKKMVYTFQEEFNEGSFNKAERYTTSDWVHINPGGGISKGRDSVLKEVRAVHQSFLKGVTMKIESINVRFITPRVAVANVIHNVDDYTTPDGILHDNERHMKSYIAVKQKNKWLLSQDNNTAIR